MRSQKSFKSFGFLSVVMKVTKKDSILFLRYIQVNEISRKQFDDIPEVMKLVDDKKSSILISHPKVELRSFLLKIHESKTREVRM